MLNPVDHCIPFLFAKVPLSQNVSRGIIPPISSKREGSPSQKIFKKPQFLFIVRGNNNLRLSQERRSK